MKKAHEDKVIIVGNDRRIINLVNKIFTKYNFGIDNVSYGKDAENKIVLNYYDFYFIDIHLDGFRLINLIKNTKENPKIIVMTTDQNIEFERKIRACGITYLLKKPFSEEEIKKLIEHNKKSL